MGGRIELLFSVPLGTTASPSTTMVLATIMVSGGIFNPGSPPCVDPDPIPYMPQIEDPLAYMTSYAPSTPTLADCDWTDRHVQTNSGDPPVYLDPGVWSVVQV